MKIEFLSRKRWFMRLLSALARRDAPRTVGFLLARRMRRCGGAAADGAESLSLLGLQKGGFNKDFEAAFSGRPEVRLFRAERTDFQALFQGLVPDAVRDYTYLGHPPEVEAAKGRYREFLGRVWEELERRGHRFDAVLSGNHVYYAERELSAMLESRGLPFVVLHKEGLKTPANAEHFIRYYRERVGPFRGRRVLVYNEVERRIQIESGITAPGQIEVVGMARLDRYHQWRAAQQSVAAGDRPRELLFFWFDRHTGIHTPELFLNSSPSSAPAHWKRLWEATVREVLGVAAGHPRLRVRIKAKAMADRGEAVRQALARVAAVPENVEVVAGGDPFELITRADLVLGLHSTALFEAIAAGKPVVVPRFEEACDPAMQGFLLDFGEGVDYADSAATLGRMLVDCAEGRIPSLCWHAGRAAVLGRWYGNPDGQSGERIWRAVCRELAFASRTDSGVAKATC